MNGTAFDTITLRAAAAISRRSSLLTLGGAALGVTLAAPLVAEAGKAGKKARKKCKKQVGKCKTVVAEFCSTIEADTRSRQVIASGGEAECLAVLNPCCEFLRNCSADDSTECIIEAFRPTKM
jgi:hypothetical protein